MTNIEHPHEGDDCQICWLIENAIRPVIEFQTREKIAKEIEAIHPDTSWTYDADILKVIERAATIARGKNE